MSSKSKKKSYSGKKLLDAVEGTSVEVEELTEEIISPGNVTSGITTTGKQSVSMQIELILSLIPAKGGVSNATIQKMQVELEELFDTEVSKAVGAAESRIRAECALSSSTSKTDGLSRDEFTELFRAGIREIVPELVKLSGDNSAGYGPRRDKEMDSLAKSIQVRPWKGPDDRSWEKVRLDVKKNAKIHNCLDILDGTLLEPDLEDDEEPTEEWEKWRMANTRAIILLSNTFSDYEASGEIIQLYTEEEELDGNAYDCWLELDGEFDDDGVYDRVLLESRYEKFYLKVEESPTRFLTQLNNLRNKLKRVGCAKDDETFLYDIIKKLPRTGEYATQGMDIQKSLRPREVLKKKYPYITEEEVERKHPLIKLKEVKEW